MPGAGTVHHGVRYTSTDRLAAGLEPAVREALGYDTHVAVALDEPTAASLRALLAGDADDVEFLDPTRPSQVDAFQLAAHRARTVRATADRGHRSLFVAQNQPSLGLADDYWLRLESALATALAGLPVTLLCPYLCTDGVDEPPSLRAVHDTLTTEADLADLADNPESAAPAVLVRRAGAPAPESLGTPALRIPFGPTGLGEVRACVAELARRARLGEDAGEDLVYAVNEVVSNGVEHGSGSGVVEAWMRDDGVVLDVVGGGRLGDLFPGVVPPPSGQARGRGLWLARMLCTDVLVHSDAEGTRVRLTTLR